MDPRYGIDGAERQTLERWALADWSEAAEARVASVVAHGRRAAVNLLLDGVYFRQDELGQWYEAGSGSGHADRSVLHWLGEEV